MLQNIHLKNYKAFQQATIPLKPITILLGANSVGKSSLIQLMLMLQQTGKAGFKSYKSPLKLYGGYVNLGDSINLFRNQNDKEPLQIGFDIKSNRLKNYLKEELIDGYSKNFIQLPLYLPIKGLHELRKKEISSITDFEVYIDGLIDVLSKEETKGAFINEINWILRQKYDYYLPQIRRSTKKQFIDAYDFLQILAKSIKNESFSINFNITHTTENLITTLVELIHNDCILLKLTNINRTVLVESELFDLTKSDIALIVKYFDQSNTIFNSFDDVVFDKDSESTILSSIIIRIFKFFQNEIKKEFIEESINYVSPLRAHPKRYYMLDKAKLNLTLDTLDGDAIAEVIKDDSKIKAKVNKWFKTFGIQINVQGFKEVIHHLKVEQSNLTLDITDVGFGISQVLPVIIQGFLSADNSTTIIEQPEIHLHPKIQADLADLFIDIVKNASGKKLVIETHSEYILKRLRRRISEGKISPNQVAICLIDPQTSENGAVLTELKIEEKGFFDWPIDFYGGELYEDTTIFLKNQ